MNKLEINILQSEYISSGMQISSIAEPKLNKGHYKQVVTIEGTKVSLSRREFQCLKLLAHGRRIKEIANFLNISPRTVEDYITIFKNKTNYCNHSSLVDFYWRYVEPKIITI